MARRSIAAHERPPPPAVIEIGCYDAKTVSYLDRSGIVVSRYVGYEADSEVVSRAQAKWAGRPEITIVRSTRPANMDLSATFDIGICMETLEHLPDELVDGYLKNLAQVVRGPVFFTFPVERGAMLVAKQLGYRVLRMRYGERLPWRDLWAGAFSRMELIQRNEHRGFDDRRMVERIARYFDISESGGLFVPYFTTLNFTVGVIGTANRAAPL